MKEKKLYSSPELEVIDIALQGVICGSNVDPNVSVTFYDAFGEEETLN